MKHIYRYLLAICLIAVQILFLPAQSFAAAWPDALSIQADGGILMEAQTGTILFEKNADTAYYPASITKVLTALIVLERANLDDVITYSHDAVYNVEEGSSSAGIDEGDQLSVRESLYALLLASANESANALAEHVAGSREAFAQLMNEKAAELGCTGSHFANPSGLNDENHYVTAHDMALIMRAAIQNPDFLEICGTRTHRLPNLKKTPASKYPDGYPIAHHDRMLFPNDSNYYQGILCGKTGYTSLAGNTLVSAATRGNMTLITVVLNGHQTQYSDTRAMMDFGFTNFQTLKIADYETTYTALPNDMTIAGMTSSDDISLSMDTDSTIVLPMGVAFSEAQATVSYELDENAPQDAILQVEYSLEGRSVGKSYLLLHGRAAQRTAQNTADHEKERSEISGFVSKLPDFDFSKVIAPIASRGILAIIGVLAILIVIALAVRLRISQKKARQEIKESRDTRRSFRSLSNMGGYSSSAFDRIMDQYRPGTESTYTPRSRKRRRRRFPFFRK